MIDAVHPGMIELIKRIPGVSSLTATDSYRMLRHRATLLLSERRARTFTHFLRAPTQFTALRGPVLEFLAERGRDLRIVVLGCSNGAEAYTIASTLRGVSIDAYDIDPCMIDQARSGRYSAAEVHDNKMIAEAFLVETFDRQGDFYQVKPEVAAHVQFGLADVFDQRLQAHVGTADIVFVQNLLYHFRPRQAARAFMNITGLLADRAALFVDGMDLDLRARLTAANRLEPLDHCIEEIHEEARRVRGSSYPYVYFGLEPLRHEAPDWKRRYATIFLAQNSALMRRNGIGSSSEKTG
jgi:chemotaxis methyl-accepting protein methylase